MNQLVKPWYGGEASAGACLYMAQLVVGADGGPYSATAAANATKYRHYNSVFPSASVAVVWFSHWGVYTDYRNDERRYEDWGHVVIWDPTAFNRTGGFFSSRRWDTGGGEWFRTVADVEASFSSTFRFWSEDINGVRVCEPASNKPSAGKPVEPESEGAPMGYITLDTNKKKTKQTLTDKARFLHKNDAGDTAITTKPGDYVLAVEVHVKGEPGVQVTLTARRYVYDKATKKYTENVYLNSADVVIGATGKERVSFPVSNRVSGANRRIGVAAVVQQSGKTVTVERFAAKGHQWEL